MGILVEIEKNSIQKNKTVIWIQMSHWDMARSDLLVAHKHGVEYYAGDRTPKQGGIWRKAIQHFYYFYGIPTKLIF